MIGGIMKKISIVFLILMCTWVSFAQQKSEPTVTIKDGEQVFCVVQEFKGPYDTMTKSINLYINEFFKQGLVPEGPLYSIYLNSPQGVKPEELKWAVGFSVNQKTEPKEPLKKMELNYKKAAVYMHVGPYSKLGGSYTKVFKYIEDNGYKLFGPTFERYLDDPMQVKPENLRTEIVMPVEKK